MNGNKTGLLTAAVLLLAACGGGEADTPVPTASNTGAQSYVAPAASDPGSIDFAITGKTVGANQDQCELSFVVSNNSHDEVKNLYVEFAVSNAASGALLRADEPVVVPGSIPPGQSQAPFGPSYVNLACSAVQLKPRDLVKRSCRKDCVPYRYTASGIAALQ